MMPSSRLRKAPCCCVPPTAPRLVAVVPYPRRDTRSLASSHSLWLWLPHSRNALNLVLSRLPSLKSGESCTATGVSYLGCQVGRGVREGESERSSCRVGQRCRWMTRACPHGCSGGMWCLCVGLFALLGWHLGV